MIEIRNVSKKYKEKIALANCNLQIPKGQVIGLFGADVYKRQIISCRTFTFFL